MSITFSFPYNVARNHSTATQIVLRAPIVNNFSDREVTLIKSQDGSFRTLFEFNPNGDILTDLEFIILKDDDRDELRTFLLASEGHYLRFVDESLQHWLVLILNDSYGLTREGRTRWLLGLQVKRWKTETIEDL